MRRHRNVGTLVCRCTGTLIFRYAYQSMRVTGLLDEPYPRTRADELTQRRAAASQLGEVVRAWREEVVHQQDLGARIDQTLHRSRNFARINRHLETGGTEPLTPAGRTLPASSPRGCGGSAQQSMFLTQDHLPEIDDSHFVVNPQPPASSHPTAPHQPARKPPPHPPRHPSPIAVYLGRQSVESACSSPVSHPHTPHQPSRPCASSRARPLARPHTAAGQTPRASRLAGGRGVSVGGSAAGAPPRQPTAPKGAVAPCRVCARRLYDIHIYPALLAPCSHTARTPLACACPLPRGRQSNNSGVAPLALPHNARYTTGTLILSILLLLPLQLPLPIPATYPPHRTLSCRRLP